MEIRPICSNSRFHNVFGKILSLLICLTCFLPEQTIGQNNNKEKKDKQQFNKVTVCHNGETIEISESALQAHLNHGDSYGPCVGDVEYTGVITPYIPQVGKIEENIGPDLTSLFEIYDKTGVAASNEIFAVKDNSLVFIDIYAVDGKVSDLAIYLTQTLGITEIEEYALSKSYGLNKNLITALTPISKLPEFNNRDDIIQFVDPVYTPITNLGAVTTQGDIAQKSDPARTAFNINGANIKVGALSDGYNALGLNAAAADVQNGDLPGSGNLTFNTPVLVIKDYPADLRSQYSSFDEGRAMLQIIHDVAPGAELFFHTGVESSGMMIEGILQLRDLGCQIIVDDITHYREPFFQDGNIAQVVNLVADDGVSYFTSAGNFGVNSYEAQFTPAADFPSNHDFNAGGGQNNVDTKQEVSFGNGFVRIVLQWDDNYKSLPPYASPEVDLDIYLITDDEDTVVNNNSNNLNGDPFEMMTFNVQDGFANANIVIHRASGTKDVNFKYIVFESKDFQFNEHTSGSSTITGHANATGATTVGAVLYENSQAFGGQPSIASFSSRGGIVMNGEQSPRNKPNLSAPNGVNTTVSFGDIILDDGSTYNIDGDNFPNFFGTSAAVPHAAGAAALIMSAFNQFGVSGDAVDILMNNAIDMESPDFDFSSGEGFIHVDTALMAFANPIPNITGLLVPEGVTPGLQEFDVMIEGRYLTEGARVMFNGDTIPIENTSFINSSQVKATIPVFEIEDDPPLFAINSSITPSGLDGGMSNALHFYKVPKRKVIVMVDDTTKKFGEILPEFTVTILIDSIPLSETEITADSLGLSELEFQTSATSSSNVGVRSVNIVDPTDLMNPDLFDLYDFDFSSGNLFIKELPITIIPNDTTLTYGDKIEGLTYSFNFDSTNMDLGELGAFLDSLEQDYKSTFKSDDSIALVDRSRFLVNRSRFLVNGTGWTATELALKNRSRFLVNGNTVIEIDTTLLYDYQSSPDGTIADRSRFLVNGQSLANGEANYTLEDRSRFLVNNGAMVNSDGSTEGFEDIVVIADVEDSIVTNIYSINLISGLEVTWGTDSLHYIIPGAFMSPKSQNFEITYGIGNLEILPATLNVEVDDKDILSGVPLPVFTSTITGYKYDENDSIVFSSITYSAPDTAAEGTYSIIPTFEFRDNLVNYIFDPFPILPGTLTVWERVNGRVAFVSNRDGNYEIYTMNSDGTNQQRLTNNAAIDADPAWNPIGTLIAYREQSTESIGIMEPDGSKVRNISSGNPSNPAWSSDGSTIIYGKGGDIYSINVDGSGETQITSGENIDGSPDYSPDGSKIVFERDNNLWLMNADGTQEEPFLEDELRRLTHPKYSPDGSQIVFNWGTDIATINADGTGFNQLFDPIAVASDVYPDWSPDGSRVILHVFDGNNDIWTINPDGSQSLQLTTDDASDTEPDWSISPDVIYVPDPNFEQALIDLNIDSDGLVNQQILKSDALAVDILDVSDPVNNANLPNVEDSIYDLTGIEGFTNLTRLYCQINQLDSLDLSKNTQLIQLWCFNNKLSVLDLSANPALDDLLCYENRLTSLDVTQNAALLHLNCYGNLLTSLDVSNNTLLTGLSCYDNQISVLEISNNTALTGLDCAGNLLDSLNVSANINLTYLSCPFNQLNTLDVSVNTALVDLLVAGNQLTSLDIRPNTAITRLYCEGNQLSSLDLRNGNNENFVEIRANDNNLSCISVDDETADHSSWDVDNGVVFSNNCNIVFIPDPNFEQALIDEGIDGDSVINQQILRSDALATTILDLGIAGRGITDMTGIQAFENLTQLTLANNNLSNTLDLSRNTALTHLRCDANNLTELDLSNNTALTFLRCDTNPLGVLDVSNNTSLRQLFCLQNDLTSLDLSNNFELEWLSAALNSLQSLDVSSNVVLRGLFVSNNDLLQLDLSNNLLLEELNATNNSNLSCITIDPFTDRTGWLVDPGVIFSEDCSNAGFSGPRTITGRVIFGDTGESLPGINILIKGTTTGTITDFDGNYAIGVSGNDAILVTSFVGYTTVEDTVGDRTRVDITLWPSSSGGSSSIVKGEITIYPNPVIDVMTISHADPAVELSDMGIAIYDSQGSPYPISSSFVDVPEGFEIDLYELISGNYILHISDGKTIEVFRIQKE